MLALTGWCRVHELNELSSTTLGIFTVVCYSMFSYPCMSSTVPSFSADTCLIIVSEHSYRIQKENDDRERMRLEEEENEIARQKRLIVERERQARDERKRKKEQLVAQRKFEEELRKEREHVEEQIEEERRKEYAEKIAHLEEAERERLMEERRLEEERIKREIQEEKERREAERMRMLEERRKMEEELAAARDRQLARQTFLESLLRDFQNLLLNQRVTRAFTFSYFDIMPWFKDRWRDLEKDRPVSKISSTPLDTVPEEPENEVQ